MTNTKRPSRAKFPEGCKVRIEKPFFATRVGYPLCADDLMGEATAILIEKGLIPRLTFDRYLRPVPYRFDEQALIRKYAVLLLRHKKWGGNERSIHTVERPEMGGVEMMVVDSRTTKTGTRFPPEVWGGENDYDVIPGGLDNVKTTILLHLGSHPVQCHFFGENIPVLNKNRWNPSDHFQLVIAADNVVKLA